MEFLRLDKNSYKESNIVDKNLNLQESLLFQNSPNPFSESTTIKYVLGANSKSASLLIFDLSGKLLKTYVVDNKSNNGEIIIPQGTLHAGMFVYSLIVNNVVVDTKRMVISN